MWLFGLLMVFRLGLFIFGNVPFDFKPLFATTIRIIRIFSVVLTIIFIVIDFPIWLSFLIFTFGEIADRITFYDKLEVPDIKRALNTKSNNLLIKKRLLTIKKRF